MRMSRGGDRATPVASEGADRGVMGRPPQGHVGGALGGGMAVLWQS